MPAQYADFEEVRALPTNELRLLLREAEPVVRAWAGWALGLRIGRAADPELARAANESPTPGVRRLLLVILAGHQERDLLEVFARRDPDDQVRATAAQYLGMTAGPNEPAVNELLADLLERDPSPGVRWEILWLTQNGQVEIPEALVEKSVADADPHVRFTAAEVLLARVVGGEFPAALEPRPILEADDELRALVTRAWIQAGGARQLLQRLASSPAVEHVTELLSAIANTHERFGWEELEPFATEDATVKTLVAKLLDAPFEVRSFAWLVDVATGPFEPIPPATSREASHRITAMYIAASAAQERLAEGLDGVDPKSLPDQVRAAVVRLAAAIESRMEEEREIARDEEGIELDELAPSEQPPYFAQDATRLEGLRRLMAAW